MMLGCIILSSLILLKMNLESVTNIKKRPDKFSVFFK